MAVVLQEVREKQQEQNNDSVGYTTISKAGALKNAAVIAATFLATWVCPSIVGRLSPGRCRRTTSDANCKQLSLSVPVPMMALLVTRCLESGDPRRSDVNLLVSGLTNPLSQRWLALKQPINGRR